MIYLPIELWNIIFNYNTIKDRMIIMRLFAFHSIFTYDQLNYLKKSFIFKFILSNKLNNQIMTIFNNINTINNNNKYISYFTKIYEYRFGMKVNDILISSYLRNHLCKKLTKINLKNKFLNLTKKIKEDNNDNDIYINTKTKNKLTMIDCI